MVKEKNNLVTEDVTPAAEPTPAPPPILKCRTLSPNKSFVRCGVRWTDAWQPVPVGFTPEQIARVRADKMLQVK